MSNFQLRPFLVPAAVIFLSGCATAPTTESGEAATDSSSTSSATAENRGDAPRERLTATETAVAERRSSSSGGRDGGGNTPGDTAKLVEQLNEAARELATLRTANARLRTERERPRTATEPVAKADPADERLAASLKTFSQFKQEMAAILAEIDRMKKANADLNAELKSAADQTKSAAEQTRQAKAALQRVEDDLRAEKRSRLDAETTVAQLRDQLRTIARAMSSAGLSAEKLSAQAEGGEPRGRAGSRPPTRYVVREGDTLEKIADRMYGDTGKWRVILDANRGRVGVDRLLEIGMELEIPRN